MFFYQIHAALVNKIDKKTSCIKHSVLPRLLCCLSLIISKVSTFLSPGLIPPSDSLFLSKSLWLISKSAGPDKTWTHYLTGSVWYTLYWQYFYLPDFPSYHWCWVEVYCVSQTSPYIHPKATDLNIQLTCLEISPHDYIRQKSMPNGPKCSYKACHIYVYIVQWEQAAQPPILTSLISMIYMKY